MKEWRVAQEIYHRLHKDYEDDLNNVDIVTQIVVSDNIVDNALEYFNSPTDIGWIYPAKSYVVAICYARWLAEDFEGEEFYDLLNDEMLLAGNDPYFVPYLKDPDTYNKIISRLTYYDPYWDRSPLDMGVVPDIRKYYEAEFNIT